jgi:hypothetical protein
MNKVKFLLKMCAVISLFSGLKSFLCNYDTLSSLHSGKLVKLFVIEIKLSLQFVIFSNRMWTLFNVLMKNKYQFGYKCNFTCDYFYQQCDFEDRNFNTEIMFSLLGIRSFTFVYFHIRVGIHSIRD